MYVLESFYKAPRDQVADAMRSLVAMRSMISVDPTLLLRAIECYEIDSLDLTRTLVAFGDAPADASGTTRWAGRAACFAPELLTVRWTTPAICICPGRRPTCARPISVSGMRQGTGRSDG